jgi:hypothetical protein
VLPDIKTLYKTLTPTLKRSLAAFAVLASIGAVVVWRKVVKDPAPPAPAPAPAPVLPVAPEEEVPVTKPLPTTVQIVFNTIPAVEATVSWGKKKLGVIMPRQPLIIERPRDSGPLDVIVKSVGFFPVHTRVHTFSDTKHTVKLTLLEEASTLLGYRVPLDAGAPLDGLDDIDGGASYDPAGLDSL